MKLNRLLAVVVCLLLLYSTTHRPDEEDFNRWLEDKYDISCASVSCTTQDVESGQSKKLILTGSRTKEGYLFFNTVAKTFEGKEGRQTTIKAIGFLGNYYTIVEEIDRPFPRG
ncbi:hypothetical protein V1502_12410 [Bacillus sp. SCS-153A]|uniref:hypothetical protein n=1 Tax=Rossellomorea sedimentorum TaxID=3115294 RepID=UPI0039062612